MVVLLLRKLHPDSHRDRTSFHPSNSLRPTCQILGRISCTDDSHSDWDGLASQCLLGISVVAGHSVLGTLSQPSSKSEHSWRPPQVLVLDKGLSLPK